MDDFWGIDFEKTYLWVIIVIRQSVLVESKLDFFLILWFWIIKADDENGSTVVEDWYHVAPYVAPKGRHILGIERLIGAGLLWSTYDDEWWVDLVILILTWLSSYRRCGDCSYSDVVIGRFMIWFMWTTRRLRSGGRVTEPGKFVDQPLANS